jgi:hypothetical protein
VNININRLPGLPWFTKKFQNRVDNTASHVVVLVSMLLCWY